MLIYKITNRLNGKVYVGQTRQTLRTRWRQHVIAADHSCRQLIGRAIARHGEFNFHIEELCTASTPAELDFLEIVFIALCQSQNSDFGYNVLDGGRGSRDAGKKKKQGTTGSNHYLFGKNMPFTTRLKISTGARGRVPSEESRTKKSRDSLGEGNPFFGKTHSASSLRKMRAAHEGKEGHRPSEAGVLAIRNALTGRVRTVDHKVNLSNALRGRKLSKEHRRKIGIAISSVPRTPEWKAKIGLAHKGKVVSPETRKKLSDSRKKNPVIIRSCIHCLSDFEVSSRLSRKYCNSICYHESRVGKSRGKGKEAPCSL